MKFYEIRDFHPKYPGRNKVLAYTGTVLFRHKGKEFCY